MPALCAPLAPGTERRLPVGLLVRAAYSHQGAARLLVHRLKYEAIRPAAARLAASMVALLPQAASVLVPVPRVRARAWRYGVDPAIELAVAIGGLASLPVARLLRPQLWSPRQAGRARAARLLPTLVAARRAPGMVLVDDVITTGATLTAAHLALDRSAVGAVVATGGILSPWVHRVPVGDEVRSSPGATRAFPSPPDE